MGKKLSRRDFLRRSMMTGASVVLAACAPAAPKGSEPTTVPTNHTGQIPFAEATVTSPTAALEPVELRFMWWGGQQRANVTATVIKMFETRYPYIKFTYEFLGFNEYWTKVTTQAAGGSLPDIMQTGSTQIVEWARKGLVHLLEEFIQGGVLNFTDIPQVLQDHGKVDDRIYAVSCGSNAIGFAPDMDAFQEAGLDVPADTWTWEEFENTVLTLHEKLGRWGFGDFLHHADLWRTLYLSHDMQLYAADGKSLGYTDDQPLVDHMNMILRLQDGKAIPTLAEESEVKTGAPETAFSVTKRAAMDWLAGSNMLVAMWNAAGADRHYQIVSIPRPAGKKQGTTIRPSQFQSITSHSEHPKEAAMFLDYFTNDIDANKVLNAERGVPINSKVLSALQAEAGPAQAAIYDYLARLAIDAAPLPPLDPIGAETVRTNIYYPEFADPVRYKRITPEDGVKVLREKVNEVLADN